MARTLFVEERRQFIIDQLKQHGRVSVNDLSEKLGVSTVTIRQDLRMMEQIGMANRTYGGALLRPGMAIGLPELSFNVRREKHRNEKNAIGGAAAVRVKPGYAVALDASTTVFSIVQHLRNIDGLTVVTNSLIVAQQFIDLPHIKVLMPAGQLRSDSVSLVGRPETLPDLNLNIGFFGARGISLKMGITDVSPEESAMKQAVMANCLEKIMVVDGSKWGQVAPYTIADVEAVDRIITGESASSELVTQFREAGIEVDVVKQA
jgi:DeoR/GlpR family transcriptional regulator of sugar metabolism